MVIRALFGFNVRSAHSGHSPETFVIIKVFLTGYFCFSLQFDRAVQTAVRSEIIEIPKPTRVASTVMPESWLEIRPDHIFPNSNDIN